MLAVFFIGIHSSALGILPWLALPKSLALWLGAGVIVSGYLSLREQALLVAPQAIVRVVWDKEEQIWHLYQRDGRKRTGKLLTGWFMGPHLVILSFRLGFWRRASVVFLSDSTDPEALRRLRVRIQIKPL